MDNLFTVLMLICMKMPLQMCSATLVTEEQCKTVVRSMRYLSVQCIDREGRIMLVHL